MTRDRIAARLARAGRRAIDAFGAGVPRGAALVVRYRDFAFALAATLVFYLPALKHGSVDAGFLYGGDVLGFYWPSLVKTHALLSSFHFNAIDFSLFNGSSDFFLTANFFACHPLFVVYSLFTSAESTSVRDIGRVLVVMLAFHSFIACYFSIKLLTRFFLLEFGLASFAAIAFAFSVFMLHSHGEPQFVFCASIVPWVAYAALSFAQRPRVAGLLIACLPVLFGYLGGYMPLGVACMAVAMLLVAARLFLLEESAPLDERARTFAWSLLPLVCATLIVAPYLFAVWLFQSQTSSAAAPSLFFSAHQLAETPQTLLRLLSFRYAVPGPKYEFSVTWGLIGVTIATLFLLSPRTFQALSPREWLLFKTSAAIYFAIVLSIFGEFSVVSDLVYHFIPQVGSMHIYQRFLLPAQLLFGVMLALMLKALVQARPAVASRIALAALGAMTLGAAYVVARSPALTQEIGLNNYIVFELFLAFLFVFALTLPGRNFAYCAAIVLFTLPALDSMYDYSQGGNVLAEQKKRHLVVLDDSVRAGLVSYLKRFSDKDLIKYADITPLWTAGKETFPKSFPYLVLRELNLSSYGGFNFYLSSRADYMSRMPVHVEVAMSPDWALLTRSGADFVVARESDLKAGALAAVVEETKPEDLYRLPGGVVIVPLRAAAGKDSPARAEAFDNGYFRVVSARKRAEPKKLQNIALGKTARQSSTSGGEAKRAVDGNTNGRFEAGSVTHSGRDPNAWLEIDLGEVEAIDSVKVWNRTDCCGYRLHDFWLFISEVPFANSDTAAVLRTRARTWSKVNFTPNPSSKIAAPGARGRYVRIQLGGGQANDESILSLAEVEIFRADSSQAAEPAADAMPAVKVLGFATNNANHLRLDLEAAGPVVVEYLPWGNPRLRYYLNGEKATVVERDGLRTIDVPAGRSSIEIRYRHWPLTIFWIFCAVYLIALGWALVTLALDKRRRASPARP